MRQRYRRRRIGAVVVLLVVVLLLILIFARACGSSDTPTETSNASSASSEAMDSGAASSPEVERAARREKTTEQTTEKTSGGVTGGSTAPEEGRQAPSTLLSGAEDATEDGPLLDHRLVAYYGHPWSAQMGVLGEYDDPQAMVDDLKEQAAVYTKLDPDLPAKPTIELISSVAQRTPGDDGTYLLHTPPDIIEEYARLAEKNGLLLLLDVQLGRGAIADEVERLRPFLERPYVHLAIDTEYSVEAGEVPGQNLGSVDAGEIMGAAQTLQEIVEKEDIPSKMLLVHQFESSVVTNKELLEPLPNVEIAVHADGFGTPEAKLSKYDLLIRNEPVQYGGFKVFYRQDTPMLTPKEVLAIDPSPAVVTYQ